MIGFVMAPLLGVASTTDYACAYDRATMLALTPEKFDQDKQGGWRPLAAKPSCRAAAVELLAAYRKAHWRELAPWQLHISYWHEGQIRALMGQNTEAVPLLLAGVDPAQAIDPADYALGTVAFLQHDLEALRAARGRMAAQPRPAWFDKVAAEMQAREHVTPQWPPNLDVLDGLIACFDKTYDEAYGDCRPKAPAP